MAEPTLLLRKGIIQIQGKPRPAVQVQVVLDARVQALMLEHFSNEVLFRRAAYLSGLPAGAPQPSPTLNSQLMAFVKNDACPEITVRSILAGQTYQANTLWEVLSFEYVAKRAYEALAELAAGAAEFGREVTYPAVVVREVPVSDIAAFVEDTAAERAALAAA